MIFSWLRNLSCLGLCLAVLVGCSEQPKGFFPLDKGLVWHYRVTTERNNGIQQSRFDVRAMGSVTRDGQKQYIRRTSAGTDYMLVADELGVYRVAKRTIVEDHPRADPSPRFVLRNPLQVGTEWVALTHAYVLIRIHPFEESLSDGTNFNMNYVIESTDASVTVPAGRFEHCILVRGDANMEIYSDAVHGFSEIPVVTREWYAEGVGLVKLERTERLETDVFSGGTQTFELTSFER